jgi:hypothetical protein
MRTRLLLLLTLFWSLPLWSQNTIECGLYSYPYQLNCTNAYHCNKTWLIELPIPQMQGVLFNRQKVDCCGTPAYTWIAVPGGDCGVVELRTPESQERLAQLSDTTDFLVVGCGGYYKRYSRVGVGSANSSGGS